MSVVGRRLDDFSIFKGKGNVFKGKALENGRGIVGQCSVDGISDRGGINLAVRNIHVAGAFDGRNVLNGEGQICSRTFDVNFIRFIHQFDERRHGFAHFFIIEAADVKIKVLKGFQALIVELGHRVVWIAHDTPAQLRHADLMMDRRAVEPFIECQVLGGNI